MCVFINMITIHSFPNYLITENGEVINKRTNKKVKPFINASYYKLNLFISSTECKQVYLHRLLAETFIPNPENKKEVNHIDGNKLNNSLNNLEWVTRVENSQHSYRYGLQKSKKSGANDKSKRVLQMDLMGNPIKEWDCVMDIERELGIKNGAISNCCLGKSKTSSNFIWKYIE